MGEENQPHLVKPGMDQPAISYLDRREIQAPIAACLIKGFINAMGRERAMEVAAEAIQGDAMLVGRKIAELYGGNTFTELIRVVREVWAEGGALEFDLLEETDQSLGFNVTRCRYAELYDRLGIKEFGFCLSCNRDAPLIRGFNPHMKLLRTRTIMEGADICDFRIIIE
jgi:hypothetical protein